MSTRPEGCPEWCNRRHKPGGDPRRQRHGRTWQAAGADSNRQVRAALYSGSSHGKPAIFFDVDGLPGLASLPNGRGGVLEPDDARAFALHLLCMADCAEREAASGMRPRVTLGQLP